MAYPHRTLAELTTTADTAPWIPRDVYAKGVVLALYTERKLGVLAAARRFDVNAGEGNTIKVKVQGRRTAQGPIAEGASLVAAVETFAVVPVSIQKYGDRADLTDESITQTSDDVKGLTLMGMGLALNEKMESIGMNLLKGAAANQSVVLATKGAMDYHDVLAAEASFPDGYKPDTLLIHRTMKAALLNDPNLTKVVDYSKGTITLPGEIGSIGSVRVIVHDFAPVADNATIDALQGIMLDSSRAFVEAFGKPLRFLEQPVIEADLYKQVAWVWYGVAVADAKAITFLKNAHT